MRTTQANHAVNSAKTKSVYLKRRKKRKCKNLVEVKPQHIKLPTMKYVGYCRKSTDEKEKQVLSIDQQIYELKEFALREKIEIVDFLIEKQSAKVTGRKVFGSLIERIEKGEIQGIVAWNPDRLARNSIDGGKIIYLIDEGKLKDLKFPTHWFDNTPQGKFMLSISFGQSKYYVDNLSQNVVRGLHYKLKQGLWPTMAPFGYKNDRNTRGIILEPKISKIIKISFDKFVSGEITSIKGVQNLLTKNKIIGKFGKPITLTKVKKMLSNPFYFGLMNYGGDSVMGTHHCLVSKRNFDLVQEKLAKRDDKRPHTNIFPFTGFIKCSECGCGITAEKHFKNYPKTRGKVEYTYYRCTKKNGVCRQPYLNSSSIETQLRDLVGSLSLKEIWANKLLEMLKKDEDKEIKFAKGELDKLSFSLTETEKKLDKLLEGYLEELIDSINYQQKKKELLGVKQLIQEKIDSVRKKGAYWIEPMRTFLKEAVATAKIAHENNNCSLLSQRAKKVGSNYLLEDKRISFLPNSPHDLLASSAFDASNLELTPELCPCTKMLEPILSATINFTTIF